MKERDKWTNKELTNEWMNALIQNRSKKRTNKHKYSKEHSIVEKERNLKIMKE